MRGWWGQCRHFAAAVGLTLAVPAMAQAPTGQPSAAASSSTPPQGAPAPSAADSKAQAIDDLIAGKLSADVDASGLFETSLKSANIETIKAVVAMVGDKALYTRAKRDPAALAPLAADQARLAIAQATFLRLPAKRRQELLDRHAARAAEAERAQRAEAEQESREAEVPRQVDQLQAFLAGKPADGASLSIDLLDDMASLTGTVESEKGADGEKDARVRLAELRQQILDLSPERLSALQTASGVDVAPDAAAGIAETQKREAELQAARARSERDRIIATERSKLYAVQAAQARFAASLAELEARPGQIQEEALGWRRQVQDAEAAADSAGADALYQRLVTDLQAIRRQLRAALRNSASQANPAIVPQPLDDAITGGLISAPELTRFRQQLAGAAARLVRRQDAAKAEERKALRDAMVLVNGARLDLISHLSAQKRSAVLGFGSEGIAQVSRELSQISLDLSYQLTSWRQSLDAALLPFERPTPSFAFSLLSIIILILLFRWWRYHGAALLGSSVDSLRKRRPRKLFNEVQATLFDYVRRVGAPFDWLVFALLLRWLMPEAVRPVGLSFLWIIVIFSLVAWFLARFVNELARGRRSEDPRAKLRLKSLSLAIGVLFVVVLVLALTRESVGKGAIYHWVLSFCWLLAIPVVLVLSRWWRERIVTLARAGGERSALLGWTAQDPGGVLGLIGRAMAGGLLLAEGARAVLARRIRDFALVRELSEHRQRAVAAQQVAEDKASGIYRRLPPETAEILAPHRPPAQLARLAGLSSKLDLDRLPGGGVAAIVGERGLGKTAMLRAVEQSCSARGMKTISIGIDRRGYAGLLADLAEALAAQEAGSQEAASVESGLVEILSSASDPTAVIIDDLQRLVVPAIGGLDDLDRLIAFARRCGDRCTWFMTIGLPAWHYVSRARFDRALFDTVSHLPRWSPKELRALIERRTGQADIIPDFSDLADIGAFRFDGDLTPEQRRQAAFFERLSDYSMGNPAIALEYWRRSLFIDSTTGKTVVRTFATPDASRLAELPDAVMFVLRSILQMDSTPQPAIERSTDLPPVIVTDALRGLLRLGVIVRHEGGYRIALHWWAEVMRALQRQNLVVRD